MPFGTRQRAPRSGGRWGGSGMAWAGIGGEERAGLNVALNEASWLGIRADTEACRVAVLLDTLSLLVEGSTPVDARLGRRDGSDEQNRGVIAERTVAPRPTLSRWPWRSSTT